MPERDGSDRRAEPASELDCLRGILPVPLLHAAERRSRELNLGADQILIQWGVITEETYVAHPGPPPWHRLRRSLDSRARSLPSRLMPIFRGSQSSASCPSRRMTHSTGSSRRELYSTTPDAFLHHISITASRAFGWTTRRHLHQYLTEQTGDALSISPPRACCRCNLPCRPSRPSVGAEDCSQRFCCWYARFSRFCIRR